MIKLVAFDWNGTLLSDTASAVKAENMALRAVGAKPINIRKFQATFEIPIVKYWKALGLSEALLKKHFWTIEDTFHLNYEKFVNQARSRAGSKAVLKWLHKHKIKTVIYSNHNIPNIHRQLVRLKIDKLVDRILARKQQDHSQVFERSKNQKLFAYIQQNKIKAQEVLTVGDSEEEIEIGKKFGFHTVAITGGYNTTARLKKHEPDFLIHNMLELKKIIQKLNK